MELLAPNGMPAFKSEEDIAPIQKLIREKAELVIRNFCRSTNDKFSEPNKLDVFEVENEDANVTAQENQIDGTLVADNFRFYESKKPNIECVYQRDDLENKQFLRIFIATSGWIEAHYPHLKEKLDKAAGN